MKGLLSNLSIGKEKDSANELSKDLGFYCKIYFKKNSFLIIIEVFLLYSRSHLYYIMSPKIVQMKAICISIY